MGGFVCSIVSTAPQHSPADVAAVLESFYGAVKRGDPIAAMSVMAHDALFVESGTFEGAPVQFVSAQLMVLSKDADAWKIRSIHWSSRPLEP